MYDAIVLAGAGSRRLDGADKPALEIRGRTLLDRAIAATSGAQRVIVVGPRRETAVPVIWTSEEPPGGGPVAAIAAGLREVHEQWCLLLASDLPKIRGAVPVLLTAAADADVAVLCTAGQRNYLAAVWHTAALRAALDRLDTAVGAAARELYERPSIIDVSDRDEWGIDLDTWEAIERARRA
ncbi:MAG TPA: NTP transferase domain-containing protein [Jatrophihabitans sp.]